MYVVKTTGEKACKIPQIFAIDQYEKDMSSLYQTFANKKGVNLINNLTSILVVRCQNSILPVLFLIIIFESAYRYRYVAKRQGW